MRKKLILYLIVMFGGIGLVAAVYGLVAVFEWNVERELRPIFQVVATDIEVSSQWTEITPEPPMKVIKRDRELFLVIEGYTPKIGDDFQIELPNGAVVKPEIEVIDEFGKTFELKDTSRVGSLVGFRPRDGQLPDDRIYTKIRIRSDHPFLCSKIIWSNKTPK